MGYLPQPPLVLLALSREHLQLLLEVLQSLFDRLLTAISLFVSRLEVGGKRFAVLGQDAELLVFSPNRFIKLPDQLVLCAELVVEALIARVVRVVLARDNH